MLKKLLVVILLLSAVSWIYWAWEGSRPTITWTERPTRVNPTTRLAFIVEDRLAIQQIRVALSGTESPVLLEESHPASLLPWGDQTTQRSVAFSVQPVVESASLPDGEIRLTVSAEGLPSLGLFGRKTNEEIVLILDRRPPSVAILSREHFVRQGGSETVVYRTENDTVTSGVRVGENSFSGYPHPNRPGESIAIFALAYNQPPDTPISVWALDEAGNRGQAPLPIGVIPVRFRQRQINVDDAFIQKVAADVLPRTPEVTQKATLLDTFLELNGPLRRSNHEFIANLAAQSSATPLWTEPFTQLSNSQVEAAFADDRTYFYDGQQVDQQTHQGFDLATVAQGPAEAANSGTVVWADYLGIYGNCVIIDHGLGLLSLYGHLSSISVQKGQQVARGDEIGRTGATGLAGGDHLHFSMILQGAQVNPLEWWDPSWIRLHMLNRLAATVPAPDASN